LWLDTNILKASAAPTFCSSNYNIRRQSLTHWHSLMNLRYLSINPEDGCSMDLRNVCILPHYLMVSQPRRLQLGSSLVWKTQNYVFQLSSGDISQLSANITKQPHMSHSSNYANEIFIHTLWNTWNWWRYEFYLPHLLYMKTRARLKTRRVYLLKNVSLHYKIPSSP